MMQKSNFNTLINIYNEEEIKDKNGNIKLFTPKGRWKDLEYLTEDRDDDNFEEITQ